VTFRSYSTKDFEETYTYTGADLGAVWTKEKTVFRVWAPTAISVRVRLYKSGTLGANDLLEQLEMRPDVNGTWVAEKTGDLHGIYYTYLVDRESIVKESCDPYARAVGVNGCRAMVIDLSQTDPEGWEKDRNPQPVTSPVDAVVYELHIRDLSMDPSSGIENKGKFLGLTERGTKTPKGQPTGLDHIRDLGVTHVQLLPVYDYGSVDEAHPEKAQYNWGYDPVNYNVPEGSYATDAHNGAVRIRELKQTIKAVHDAGMGVVMDVVYNHVYDRDRFCFNRIVPGYFSRTDEFGKYSQGSGCGNDTASERSMVRKYIVDSVKYWAEEYHMDGFRFDLAGLLDAETIRQAMEAVHKTRPDVLFYGEGWNMDTWTTKQGVKLANQNNAELLPGFGFFNDSFRDTLKGTVFDNDAPGYVSGALDQEEWVRECIVGLNDWCKTPEQTVNYVSCHDNMALFDRLTQSVPYAEDAEIISMNKLAAAMCLLSQGMPLMQAGEEMLRSKPLPDGTFDENSYRSPDSVNSIKWGNLNKKVYRDVRDYYKGLIAFRKAHSALRMRSAREVLENILSTDTKIPNVTAFFVRGSDETIYMIFNPNHEKVSLKLPAGDWEVHIDAAHADTEALAIVQEQITVAPISAAVLVKSNR